MKALASFIKIHLLGLTAVGKNYMYKLYHKFQSTSIEKHSSRNYLVVMFSEVLLLRLYRNLPSLEGWINLLVNQ